MNHFKNLGKRGLALLLTLVMCVSMLSTAAFAEEFDGAGEATVCETCGKDPCECEADLCEHEWTNEAVEGGTQYTCALCGESYFLPAGDDGFRTGVLDENGAGALGGDGAGTLDENDTGTPDGNGAGETLQDQDSVAQVGSQFYPTLPEAIGAAQNGDTVTLLKDVTTAENQYLSIDKDLTLNVPEGLTLTMPRYDHGLTDALIEVEKGAQLTINGGGTITTKGIILIWAEGDVVINGGNLYATCTALQVCGGTATMNGGELTNATTNKFGTSYQTVYVDHGSFTLNNGRIINRSYNGGGITVYNGTPDYSKSTVTIKGGEVINDAATAGAALSIEDEADVVIEGGTLENTSGLGGCALAVGAKATVTIKGGSVKNTAKNPDKDNYPVSIYCEHDDALLNLENGDFTSTGGYSLQIEEVGTCSITGGTYSENVEERTPYVAEGYIARDNKNGTWTVMPPIPITGVKLDQTTLSMAVDGTATLTATVEPEDTTDDKTVTWVSSNPEVAAVENGVVTAKKPGKATITAQVGAFTAACEVTVRNAATVTISASSASLTGGGTVTLTVSGPEGGDITVSSEPSVTVTKQSDGTYTAALPNTTATYTFTASFEGDDTTAPASASVTVSVTYYTSGGGGGTGGGGTGGGSTGGGSTGGGSTGGGTGGGTTTPPNVEINDPDVPLAERPLPFTDVGADAWYREAVAYVYGNGLMKGVEETKFAPDSDTSRGMIVTVIHRLEKEPGAASESGFLDVLAGSWYKDAVDWGASAGVVTGYSEERFGPEDHVTREQLVAILYRYARMKGYDVSARADLSKFTDADEVSGYAVEAMSWAVSVGLIEGTTDTTLSPRGNATRAQIAMILMRFCKNVVPKG